MKGPRRILLAVKGLTLYLSLLLLPSLAGADAIVRTRAMTAPTIAEIFIEPTAVRVELEIGGRDAVVWQPLLSEEMDAERLALVLPQTLRRGLLIHADGEPLEARLRRTELRRRIPRDDISGEALSGSEEEAEQVLFLAYEYPFTEQPSVLRIDRPPLEEARLEIGFMTYHRGLPVTEFRYLAGPEPIDLDWQDPWYSRFRNPNLRRRFDSPINTYLYMEPYEVRHEIVVRPVDLEKWIDLGLSGRDTIPVDRQPQLLRRVADFLAEKTTLTIDGEVVRPTVERIHFLRRTLRQSTVVDPPEELDKFSAILGVIFVHPTNGLPKEAAVTWELFHERIQKVPAAFSDPITGAVPYVLSPNDNVLKWHNFLTVSALPELAKVTPPPQPPVQSLAIIGWICAVGLLVLVIHGITLTFHDGFRGGRVAWQTATTVVVLLTAGTISFAAARPETTSVEASEDILRALLHNVYLSFAFRDESTIYDALEGSMAGELLTQTYLETQRSLVLANQGGARVKVKKVELIRAEPRKLPDEMGFVARSLWNVSGSVGHWGHIHTRTNQYQAELTVKPVDGVWKITRLDLQAEQRL